MIESELEAVLSRPRYARRPKADPENYGACGVAGHRHGHRSRSLLGTFGRVEIAVPRARLDTSEGKTTEWKSKALRAYQRRTKQADSLIAGAYLAGTNTRRVRRALAAVFGGAVGKDTVSRVWRKVTADWDAWNARPLAEEPIVRLILDGTVVRVRLDRKATSIVLLVVLGVRQDGQKVLLAVKNMGGETSQAWRAVLDAQKRRCWKPLRRRRCNLGPTSPESRTVRPTPARPSAVIEAVTHRWQASCRGISGRWGQRSQRPGFDRLLTQPRAAKVAWSVERLGRSLQGPRWFFWGAERSRMRSLLKRQPVDTTRPAGRAIFQMLGVFRGVRTRDQSRIGAHTLAEYRMGVSFFSPNRFDADD